jgi:hypothetical protein
VANNINKTKKVKIMKPNEMNQYRDEQEARVDNFIDSMLAVLFILAAIGGCYGFLSEGAWWCCLIAICGAAVAFALIYGMVERRAQR